VYNHDVHVPDIPIYRSVPFRVLDDSKERDDSERKCILSNLEINDTGNSLPLKLVNRHRIYPISARKKANVTTSPGFVSYNASAFSRSRC